MIHVDKLRLFPFKTSALRIPNVATGDKYSVVYYSENISFLEMYPKMRIKRQDAYQVNIPGSILPKLIVNAKLLNYYRKNKLIPIKRIDGKTLNHYVDCSPFLYKLETQFKIPSYRSPLVTRKVDKYIQPILSSTSGFKKIFMYVIDLNRDFKANIFHRRIYPILKMWFDTDKFPFDYFMICQVKNGVPYYSTFIKGEEIVPFQRVYNFLKNQKKLVDGKEEIAPTEEVKSDTNKIVAKLPVASPEEIKKDIPDIADEEIEKEQKRQKDTLTGLIQNYVQAKGPEYAKGVDTSKMVDIGAKAILYSITGDLGKAEEIVEKTVDKEKLFKELSKELLPDIIGRSKPQNNSREVTQKGVDIAGINDNKDPSHVLNKRGVDFANSFEKDLRKTFDIIGKKSDFPLKVDSLKRETIQPESGDLEPTIEDKITIILKDEKGRKHEVVIRIPHLTEDGVFIHKGKKKYLIYQLMLDPIFFLKKWLVKLETLYAPMAIESKQMKMKQYFTVKIAGYKLPLMALMGMYLGFAETCKLFGIKYSFSEEKPAKDSEQKFLAISDTNIIFDFKGEHSRQLLESMKEIKYEFTEANVLEKKTFSEAIIQHVGNRNAIYNIGEVLSNIIEPISLEILKSKNLPTTLPKCIFYMCKEVVTGRVDIRNDLSKQRVRTSEVFNHMIMKQILHSYNQYRFQRIAGDNKAEYKCDTDRVISELSNSVLVRTLENVNPLEELSCLTRVTPIGPGGIPDANAMTDQARSTHETYYGNFDPMDTPEGTNIGTINQLTVGAALTNSRGSFIPEIDKEQGAGVLGTSTVFVPFVNTDDGARVMFSASQSRQAVPIVGNEPPLCQTGYESIMTHLLTDSYIKKAVGDGVIQEVTENIIVVKQKNGRLQKIPLTPELLNSLQGQSSINEFKPTIKKGQKVKAGQILAEGKHIKNGVISTGTNLLTALMGWKGYQTEDGYIVSDAIINNKISSKHYFTESIVIKKGDKVHFCETEGNETLKGQPLLITTPIDIEELVGLSEDELVEGARVTKSPGGKIISLEIYPNISMKKFPVLQPQFEKFKAKYEKEKGPFPAKFLKYEKYEKKAINGIIIEFKLESDYHAELGDKIANRHGNKGVITYIEKDENMPRSPWGDRVQIIFNPLSVVNRMNPGSIFEMYVGTIGKLTSRQLIAMGPKKTQKALNLLNAVYRGLDNTKGKKYSSQVMKIFSSMTPKVWAEFINDMVARGEFLPIVTPQFQTPTKQMISKTMKVVGLKNSYKLHMPEHNKKTLREVAIGWMYFNKLEQQADIKMGARSTSLYQSKTGQPTEGKKRDGGQRAGEMDVDALLSHNCVNVLKEFMGPLSDDEPTRNKIIADIIQNGEAKYREPQTSPTRDLLSAYMTALGLEG